MSRDSKLLFFDVDDTLLQPPVEQMQRFFHFLGHRDIPSAQEMIDRPYHDWRRSFPQLWKDSIPEIFWFAASLATNGASYGEVFPDIDVGLMRQLLERENTRVISQIPQFLRWSRRYAIRKAFGVNLRSRFLACGSILGRKSPKSAYMANIARRRRTKNANIVLIDDSPTEIQSALDGGFHAWLVDRPWNRETRIQRSRFRRVDFNTMAACTSDFIG